MPSPMNLFLVLKADWGTQCFTVDENDEEGFAKDQYYWHCLRVTNLETASCLRSRLQNERSRSHLHWTAFFRSTKPWSRSQNLPQKRSIREE